MKINLLLKIPLGFTIICTKERWIKHIVAGHEIMRNNEGAVVETINNPQFIYKSNHPDVGDSCRQVYFRIAESSSYKPLVTKVVVDKQNELKCGEVISTWPQESISGGIDEEGLIYVNPKLR